MKLLQMYHKVQDQIPGENYILIDYDLYFDENRGCSNGFAIDDQEELKKVKCLISELRNTISDVIIYVCAYGMSITNFQKEEILYADMLYLHTTADMKCISDIFEKLHGVDPSDIFLLSDEREDYLQEKVFLFKATGDIVNLRDEVDESFMKEIKCVYWD